MPTASTSPKTALPSLGDEHVIKLKGSDLPAMARAFFQLPIRLPAGEYLLTEKNGSLHLHGAKSGVSRYSFDGIAPEVVTGKDGVKVTFSSGTVLVIHDDPAKGGADLVSLVKRLVPVIEQVLQYHELRGRSYKAGEEARKAADLETTKELLSQIQAAYAAPDDPGPAPELAKASIPKPKKKPAPRPPKASTSNTGYAKYSRE